MRCMPPLLNFDSLMDAWMRQLNEHGVRSFIYDVLFNNDKTKRLAKIAKEYGSEVSGAIMFTLSPVHSDEYYYQKSAFPFPAICAEARGKPIEFHSNNLLGQSAKAYLDSLELGVTILHTAVRPMANGPSPLR